MRCPSRCEPSAQGLEVITYAKLVNRTLHKKEWTTRKGDPFDVSPYDVILLDEVIQTGHATAAELVTTFFFGASESSAQATPIRLTRARNSINSLPRKR
jgi:hypothetical protein